VSAQRGSTALLAIGMSALVALAACAPAQPRPAAPAAQQAPAAPAAAPPAAQAPAQPAAQLPAPSASGDPMTLTDAERQEVESFYRGKTIKLLVGFAPGAGYDLLGRLTGRSLGKYVPGNPSVVVENMPGAGSALLANHVYNVAPKDGTVIATFDPALVLVQAVGGGGGGLQFDPAKYPRLGSPNSSSNMCIVTTASGGDTMEKLIASQREITFGATSLGNSTSAQPAVMAHYLGAKVRIVTGYDGVAKIKLAVESGEVDGSCGTWETIKATNADWFTGNPPFARVVVKAKDDAAGDLKDVPLMTDFLKSDEARQVQAMAMAPQAIGFNYATTPGIPPARLKALRIAVMQAWNDPEFQSEAARSQLPVYPQDYLAVEQQVNEILSASPEMLRKAKDVLGIQ
jgi:hypothetical protein